MLTRENAICQAKVVAGQYGFNVAVYRDPVADDPETSYYCARPEIHNAEDWGGELVATVTPHDGIIYENNRYL